jgi:hypothetical protein
MYWQDVTLVDSMAPTLIGYLARWCLTLQKQVSILYFAKLKFSLANFSFKKNSFLPIFSPSSFNLRNWDEEILEQLQQHVTQIVHNQGHG